MKDVRGNLFQYPADAICITTNGFVKSNGEAVMGKGCALEATRLMPGLAQRVGSALKIHGNKVQIIGELEGKPVIIFPVKPKSKPYAPGVPVQHMAGKFEAGDQVPGWACKAEMSIITRSAHELTSLADKEGWSTILIPRPGCGAGELDWNNVGFELREILDERFYAITF